MLKHVLCVKLKDNSKQECQKLCELFLSMKERVPMIRDIEAGFDTLHSDRSYDVALIVTLDDLNALAAYQEDPYHGGIVKPYVHSKRESSVVVDFDF